MIQAATESSLRWRKQVVESGQADTDRVTMTLTFLDDTTQKFAIRLVEDFALRSSSLFREFVSKQAVSIQLADEMVVFPFAQIKSIRFNPPPAKVPEGVFANAIRLD